MKTKLALNLPSHLHSWVDAQATAHGFTSASEYVQHLLAEKRQAEAKDQIERRLLHALETNEYFDLTEEHFQNLDKKLKSLAKAPTRKRHAAKR